MTLAIVLAAGSGERLGAGAPKAFVELAGRPMVQWSIDALAQVVQRERIVVAVPAGHEDALDVRSVRGGAARSESVLRALQAAGQGDPVLVHDAARPLLTPALAAEVLAALERDPQAQAAIAAAPVTDTVKRVGEGGTVIETLQRSELWAVQTPQVFRRAALEEALSASPERLAAATDDASLIEQGGGRVLVVAASEENLKVTRPLDLELAGLLLARRTRIG